MLRTLRLAFVVFLRISICDADPIDDCNQQETAIRRMKGCTQSASENDKRAAVYINRGKAYHGKGEYDRAITDYNKAISKFERRRRRVVGANQS